jgi:YD repeat-containing protein
LYQAPGRLYAIRKGANYGQTGAVSQLTKFAYDAEGLLTRVIASDGSYVGYQYDAAHQQIAAYDSQGNRIDYTLDGVATESRERQGSVRRPRSHTQSVLRCPGPCTASDREAVMSMRAFGMAGFIMAVASLWGSPRGKSLRGARLPSSGLGAYLPSHGCVLQPQRRQHRLPRRSRSARTQ